MANNFYKQTILPALTLFTSMSTLVCCALPALLVTLGLGAMLAGLVAYAPWLMVISEHKEIVFFVSGLMLALVTIFQWQRRNAPCPVDPEQSRACSRLRKVSWVILILSLAIYSIGFFFAFVAVNLI